MLYPVLSFNSYWFYTFLYNYVEILTNPTVMANFSTSSGIAFSINTIQFAWINFFWKEILS